MSITTILALFFSFIFIILAIATVKKIYYRFVMKKRYFIIPRVSSKGIANIGMIIALSIAVIMLLTIITANLASVVFRAWAGTRVTIEGILVKISGLLFGPIIGMCAGAAIDFLTVALTGGVFHYGYLIASMSFGLIGGLIRIITTMSNRNNLKFAIYSTITSSIIGTAVCCIIWFLQSSEVFSVSFLGLEISLYKWQMVLIIIICILLTIITIWVCHFIQLYKLKKNPQANNWFSIFIPILITILLTEIIVNVLMMPTFDASLSTLSYETWFLIRLLLLVPMIILNLCIIYPIFKIVVPMMRYNYEDELVEDLDQPLFIN